MLSDRERLVLHLGLLPPEGDTGEATGHAWLSIAGEIVDVTDESRHYPEIHRIEMRRGRS